MRIKHWIVAVLVLASAPAFAADWRFDGDVMFARSGFDVSNCTGDCTYVPDSDDESDIAFGATVEKQAAAIGLGATVRVYDSGSVDAFVRLSAPIGQLVPYLGVGISRQEYSAQLRGANGGDVTDDLSAPLYVLGIENRTSWGRLFLEVSQTEDQVNFASSRLVSPGVIAPVNAQFDLERKTVLIGVSLNLTK